MTLVLFVLFLIVLILLIVLFKIVLNQAKAIEHLAGAHKKHLQFHMEAALRRKQASSKGGRSISDLERRAREIQQQVESKNQ